jgi:hypothetical protein
MHPRAACRAGHEAASNRVFSTFRAQARQRTAIPPADLQGALVTRKFARPDSPTISRGQPVVRTRAIEYREVIMQPRPPLSPEENQTIRNWTLAMAVMYSLFLLALFASVLVNTGPVRSPSDTAAAGTRQDASRTTPLPGGRQPLTEASMQH